MSEREWLEEGPRLAIDVRNRMIGSREVLNALGRRAYERLAASDILPDWDRIPEEMRTAFRAQAQLDLGAAFEALPATPTQQKRGEGE